jgi:hypothetical protein
MDPPFLLAQWPVFHPGTTPFKHIKSLKKSIALPYERKQRAIRKEKAQRRLKQQTAKKHAAARLAKQKAMHRRCGTVCVGPRNQPPVFFKPLLPRHAATTIFSWCAFQTLPIPFRRRLAAIRDKERSPFEEMESRPQTARRIALEKRWASPRPTFYEQLVRDLVKDHEKEMRLRFWFRALLWAWRYRQAKRRNGAAPFMDPVTLDPIRVPIEMMDYKAKRLFVFEAAALNKVVRQALLFQLYSVADPQMPKNPYTNLPFTYGQLVGVHQALQKAGCLSQEVHMWRILQFNLKRFKTYMDPWLYMRAQREELYDLSSEDGQQLLADFIVECLEDLGRLPNPQLEDLVRDAVEMFPGHEMLCRMRVLCLREMEGSFFQMPNRQGILIDFYNSFKSRSDLWFLVRRKREALSREEGDAEVAEEEYD